MTMLDHDAVDEIGDSEDENDGDDVNDFHYGKHKTENNSKNKKTATIHKKNELKRSYSASTLREPKTYIG
jgi:hypothetical protein